MFAIPLILTLIAAVTFDAALTSNQSWTVLVLLGALVVLLGMLSVVGYLDMRGKSKLF